MDTSFRLFPERASSVASRVDNLFLFVLLVAGLFTAVIAILILYFAVRYRRRATVNRAHFKENMVLEIAWCVVPLVLTMVMYGWGAQLFVEMHQPPRDADAVDVVAKQWMWKLQHRGGKREINELHLPVGRPVRLTMISEDVIHSFFVPNFRVKQDVLPGRYTTMWFTPTRVGSYHLFCAEYCGTSHSQMGGTVIVMEPADFANWLSGHTAGPSPELSGRQLFEKFRCHTCHQSGTPPRCPPLEGLFGRDVQLTDGRTVVANEDYLRESIVDPSAKITAGYQPLMPTFKGQIDEDGILQLVGYIKSLEPPKTPERDQAKPESDETERRP